MGEEQGFFCYLLLKIKAINIPKQPKVSNYAVCITMQMVKKKVNESFMVTGPYRIRISTKYLDQVLLDIKIPRRKIILIKM